MKTILIPLKELAGIQVTRQLRALGLLKFVLGLEVTKDTKPEEIELTPIEGLSDAPDFVEAESIEDAKHWWAGFNLENNTWTYFRFKVSETGEKILKDNKIEYEYE